MFIVNYKLKKYTKYISVYIKIKIVETSKYNLSYMRYYSHSYTRTYNNFLLLNDLK
jgi:hypothetical protein